jgi:hypothetical protein
VAFCHPELVSGATELKLGFRNKFGMTLRDSFGIAFSFNGLLRSVKI